MYDRIIVATQDAPIRDAALVEAIVHAMIGFDADLEPIKHQVMSSILQRLPTDGTGFDGIAHLANARLHELLEDEPDPRARALLISASNKVLARISRARELSLAYLPAAKRNPDAVFWPDPTVSPPRVPRSIYDEVPAVREYKFVDRTTPIGSAGSCFATEIAKHLKAGGYNYVVTEPNEVASAKWGIIFNTPSFRQLVERAFGLRRLPKLLWSFIKDGQVKYFDPFREDVIFDSPDEYDPSLQAHLAAAREALTRCKVFVITLGMNEVWHLAADGSVLSRSPWALASYLIEKRVMTVEENVAELQRMLDVWRAFNPDLKLIVTVSPVPLHATFRADDYHIIAANAHSKSVLRVAAEAFCERNRDVFYFPSYESVMYCTRNPWQDDQRHVSPEAVAQVMRLFRRMFVREQV